VHLRLLPQDVRQHGAKEIDKAIGFNRYCLQHQTVDSISILKSIPTSHHPVKKRIFKSVQCGMLKNFEDQSKIEGEF
jgi:hypothetical protein